MVTYISFCCFAYFARRLDLQGHVRSSSQRIHLSRLQFICLFPDHRPISVLWETTGGYRCGLAVTTARGATKAASASSYGSLIWHITTKLINTDNRTFLVRIPQLKVQPWTGLCVCRPAFYMYYISCSNPSITSGLSLNIVQAATLFVSTLLWMQISCI